MVRTPSKRKTIDMKKIKIFLIIFFFIIANNKYAFSENSNELYQKIDLFSEVLEKIKEDYVEDIVTPH